MFYMPRSRVLLIGKSACKDYVGSKTLYLHNALTQAGAQVFVYDLSGHMDPPPDATHVVFLPWVQTFDSGWLQFMRAHGRKRILYTDNFYWYDECRQKLLSSEKVDMDAVFNTIALATSENVRWWPKDRFELWGTCVDEDIAIARTPENYIYVDEVWPEAWSSGVWTGKSILDIAIPQIKDKYGLEIVSQKSHSRIENRIESSWVDHWIEPEIDLENMLSVLGRAKAYVTAHEESLGLMQIEAMMCATPVITTPLWSKAEILKAGPECVFQWQWPTSKKPDGSEEIVEDAQQTAQGFMDALSQALGADRAYVREVAVSIYGKQAFLNRSGLVSI